MLDELYNYFLDFFSLLFSGLMNFISSNEIVFYFFVIPIATSVILFAGYFLIDISHVLDDYNAKNTFLYKGMKNYDKRQAEIRKNEEKRKEAEEKAYQRYMREYEREKAKEKERREKEKWNREHPFVHTKSIHKDKRGQWVTSHSYHKRDDIQPFSFSESDSEVED